jgi:hypothetical protein
MEKIENIRVCCVIFDDLHRVMYTSINPNETNKCLKGCGKEKVVKSFQKHRFGDSWIQDFWTHYC